MHKDVTLCPGLVYMIVLSTSNNIVSVPVICLGRENYMATGILGDVGVNNGKQMVI